MEKKILIKIGETKITAILNKTAAAKTFYQRLPMRITMDRWGGEYYGDCGFDGGNGDDPRDEMEVGELAIWPQGFALCIFFGPTPASIDEKPRAIAPVIPIGKISDDINFLNSLPGSIEISIEKVHS